NYISDGCEAQSCTMTKYVNLGGILIARRRNDVTKPPTTVWFHTDQLGSLNVTSDSNGVATPRAAYNPYGSPIQSIADEAHSFAGERRDESGLIFLRARYLDPDIGQFVSADPTTGDGVNRYWYAHNNPVAFVDPSGLEGEEADSGGAGGGSGTFSLLLSDY